VYETEARVFLKFAQEDLLDGPDRGYVNALGNAKRAVENRVDTLLYASGLKGYRENYPTKAEKLRLTGLFVPDALQHMITSPRNDLEHEYKIPRSRAAVKDKVEVAQLFLENTNALIDRGLFRWIVGPRTLPGGPNVSGWRVKSLAPPAFGLLIDRQKRILTYLDQGSVAKAAFGETDAAQLGELFGALRAGLEPGKTQIVGPMTESAFETSFL